jgi:hypothetical protein
MTAPVFVGVRHHSPACARLVRHELRRLRPAFVLVEGPADMNGRLQELRLPHELPVATFSYHTTELGSSASFAPFCEHSPEWIAVVEGGALGADVRFIDLPAWHPAFQGVENRFADRELRTDRLAAALCARAGVGDVDALWDHLFEQPLGEEALQGALTAYFDELRGDDPGGPRDEPREDYMARWIAWAMARASGPVVVVCGGWHAPALRKAWSAAANTEPEVPAAEGRHGTYLVPYSYRRLDSFTGYEAGMPSPAFQAALWRHGADQAGEGMMATAVERLRKRKQHVSSADLIAASGMAQGLRRLRGHAALARVDVLDGLAAGLVKDALEVPLPWTYRGPLLPKTEPVLVEVMAAFSGETVGRLAPGTPRPPLVEDAARELEAHDLVPGARGRAVVLELTVPAQVKRSRVLHRLRVLGIPGFRRVAGPGWATEGPLDETWSLERKVETEAALIEAAAWGATLESAAGARIEHEIAEAQGRLARIAELLADAVFVGVHALTRRLLDVVRQGIVHEPSFAEVGRALARVLGLYAHDHLFDSAGSAVLATAVAAAWERGLWLCEAVTGSGPADAGQIGGVVALRDALRYAGPRLGLSTDVAWAVMDRRSVASDAPPALRGAALGFLWSTGRFAGTSEVSPRAAAAVRAMALPATLGDFLAGLLAVAREEAVNDVELVRSVDEAVRHMDVRDFLNALAPLRLAFSYLPPAEREQVARRVLGLHGRDPGGARAMVAPGVAEPRALWVDDRVTDVMSRYALEER